MAIAIDSSTPALATANTGNAATTASFTPPAGAVLAAFAWHDTAGGNTTNSSSASDSQASAWAIGATRAKPDSGAQNGHVQVSTAVPAASIPSTVTTTAINTGGSLAAGLYCAVLTGCDPVTPIDAIAEGSSASAVISQLLTTVTDGALIMLINSDWNVAATPTPAAGLTTIVGTGLGAGPDMRIWLVRQTLLQSPAGAATPASIAPTSGNTNNWIGVAFRPAATGTATPVPPMPARRRSPVVARVLPAEARTFQAPAGQQQPPVEVVQARRRPLVRSRRARVCSPPWPVTVLTPPVWVPLPKRPVPKLPLIRRDTKVSQPPWIGAAAATPPVWVPQPRRDRPLLPTVRRDRVTSPPADRTQFVPAPRRDRPLPPIRIRHPFRIVLPIAAPELPPPIVLQQSRRRPRFLAASRSSWSAPLLEGVEPVDCIVLRPNTGTVSRVSTGTVTRPNTGIVEHCSCCT